MFYLYLPALLSLAAALNPTSQATQTYPQQTQQQQQQQQQVSPNVWDRIDYNKLDKEPTSWHKEPQIPSANPSANQGEVKQSYGDIPRPIPPFWPPPTTKPTPPTSNPEPPVLPEGCLALRGQFASWKSCSSYLNCWDGIVIEQECPGGLLFNEYKNYCDFSYNVYCGSRPAPTPQPELQPGSNTCPTPNGQYRSSTNCSEFYVCVYGKPTIRHCPRGLVYNDEFGICDYLYRVDCRGAAEPAPWSPPIIPHPPHHSHPPTPPPSYYPPQQVPQPQYPANPWLTKGPNVESEPWHQGTVGSSWEKQQGKEKDIKQQQQQHGQQGAGIDLSVQQEEAKKLLLENPWGQTQVIPAQLDGKRCTDGDVRRLTNSCSSVVVCRNGVPELVECLNGQAYDKPSDLCKPFAIAKWSV